MKSAVLPKFRTLFHDFDPAKYAEVKCVLCHGSGVKNGTFKMPNPDLPKLPTKPAEMQKLHEKNAKVMDFMIKEVKPTMADLLGEPGYDPKTNPNGFGCFGCHTKK
jgi:hypothetical protein